MEYVWPFPLKTFVMIHDNPVEIVNHSKPDAPEPWLEFSAPHGFKSPSSSNDDHF